MAMFQDDQRRKQPFGGPATGGAMGQSMGLGSLGKIPGMDGGGLQAGGGAMGQGASLPGLGDGMPTMPQATTNTGLSNGMGLGQIGNPGAMTNSFAPTEGDF
ncbi:MAG: hypothetical protein V4636_12445, partial [Pseudomonadota bacterium]